MGRGKRPMNDIRVVGRLAYMDLTDRRGNVVATTVLSARDVKKVLRAGHRWSAARTTSGVRVAYNYDGRTVLLSRYLLDAPDGLQVDHRNRDTLDNRRQNLRLATHSENMQNKGTMRNNRCGARNVSQVGPSGRFDVRLTINGRLTRLGTFATLEEATKAARDARRLYMPFAHEAEVN